MVSYNTALKQPLWHELNVAFRNTAYSSLHWEEIWFSSNVSWYYDSTFWFSFSPLLVRWKYVDWKEGCVSKNKSTNKILIVSHHHEQVKICFHLSADCYQKKKSSEAHSEFNKTRRRMDPVSQVEEKGWGRRGEEEGGGSNTPPLQKKHFTTPPAACMLAVLHCQRASILNTTTPSSMERNHKMGCIGFWALQRAALAFIIPIKAKKLH